MAVPRLCCMKLEDKESGFGFSLIATKNEVGQYIDEVKEGSLADRAGLKNGDFLVEVNGQNILSCSHPEVVEAIKKNEKEVSLLVLDAAARRYYDEISVIVNSSMPEVEQKCSWDSNPTPSDNAPDGSQLSLGKLAEERSKSREEASHLPVSTSAATSLPSGDIKSEKATEPTHLPSGPLNVSRNMPSRKACMGSGTTFGARAKVFDEL